MPAHRWLRATAVAAALVIPLGGLNHSAATATISAPVRSRPATADAASELAAARDHLAVATSAADSAAAAMRTSEQRANRVDAHLMRVRDQAEAAERVLAVARRARDDAIAAGAALLAETRQLETPAHEVAVMIGEVSLLESIGRSAELHDLTQVHTATVARTEDVLASRIRAAERHRVDLAAAELKYTRTVNALTAAQQVYAAAEATRSSAVAAVAALEAAETRRQQAASAAAAHTDQMASGVLAAPVTAQVTSPYGMRTHPITGVRKLHTGTDFGANCGVRVHAAAAGRVEEADLDRAYGNRVVISHGLVDGSELVTTYNHLSSIAVEPGDAVSAGAVVGSVGSTGYSTGCHLHWEVLIAGDFTDPMTWLQSK